MRFRVAIVFEVESSEYQGVQPTVQSVTNLAKDMLNDLADLPNERQIEVKIIE